jgi:hypothetical protein
MSGKGRCWWPVEEVPSIRWVPVLQAETLREVEERVDALPAVRRERRPYRGARVDRSALVDQAQWSATVIARRRGGRSGD